MNQALSEFQPKLNPSKEELAHRVQELQIVVSELVRLIEERHDVKLQATTRGWAFIGNSNTEV